MRASDEERREVARMLRGIKDTREGCGHELCCDLWDAIFNCGYRCTGLCDECEVAVLDSLAVLIEPEPERTCLNVSNDEKWFTCSECGANVYGGSYSHSYVDEAGARWYTTANKPGWNFCPNCGAKVIKEDACR